VHNSKIRTLTLTDGRLTEGPPISLPTKDPSGRPVTLFPAGIALTPDDRRLVVADQLGDAVTVVDTATTVTHTVSVGHRPYGSR
jgi:YVTN family beta-propeller protein